MCNVLVSQLNFIITLAPSVIVHTMSVSKLRLNLEVCLEQA